MIDQKTVFIGSLNMDERSARINSELGLVLRSADIARQVTSLFDDISTDGSYTLRWAGDDHVEWVVSDEAAPSRSGTPIRGRAHGTVLAELLSLFAPDELL